MTCPARNELRPEGDDDQNRELLHFVNGPVEEFEHGRVCPVNILVDGEQRLPCRQALYLLQESLERSLLLLVWAKCEWRVSLPRRDCQEVRKNRRALMHVVCGKSEHGLEFIELFFGSILPSYSCCPLKEPNDRIQGGAGMERRTEMAQWRVRRTCEVVAQRPHEPGLANACFAAEQDNLSLSLFRVLPALQEQCKFLVSSDERGRCHAVLGVEFDSRLRPHH